MRNKHIGYIQGLNFLAGTLLLQCGFDLTSSPSKSTTEEEAFSMLTIVLEDYGLGEMYLNGFDKLNLFLEVVEGGVRRYIPKLGRLFRDEASMMRLVVTQWVITMFTMDFSIELSFCIIDIFLVFGWSGIYGVILNIFLYLKSTLLRATEEEAIQYIKKYIKEGNIDLDHFFQEAHKFKISEKELKSLGKRFPKAYLPTKIINKLSIPPGGNEMFSTFDAPSPNIAALNDESHSKNTSTLEDESIKIEAKLKYKKRERNRAPRKFDSKRGQIRLSSANHYKPLENIRSPLPIQVSSDSSEDIKSVERPPYTEEGKFMIPNEGNVNKSPMFLLKKDNKANAFINSSGNLREKSLSLHHYEKTKDGKRSTTPQQKNKFLYANLLDHKRSEFESVRSKGDSRKSYKIDTKTIEDVITNSAQREFTQKAVNRFDTEKILAGAVIGSKMPQGIGKIRQSLEQPMGNEPEDFGISDTDERVNHKRNDTMYEKDKHGYNRKFPIDIEKGAQRFKEQLERHRNFQKSNTYRSEPRNLFKSEVYKVSHTFKPSDRSPEESHPQEFRKTKYSLMQNSQNPLKKRKNRKELNSFQDNIDDLDNLSKLANEHKKILQNHAHNPSPSLPITRHSNPNAYSPNSPNSPNSPISQIQNHKNPPKDLHTSSKPTPPFKKEEEIDEMSLYESPRGSSGLREGRRGLVINASGTKKPMSTFSKPKSYFGESEGVTVGIYSGEVQVKGYKRERHNAGSVNLNHRILGGIGYNKTQRIFTEGLGISPKKGVDLVPIKSKQTESLDSFDRENTVEEKNLEHLLDVKRKKNKRNIARDFNTNDKQILLGKHLEFDEVEGEDDRIQNPFISPHRTTIPIELTKKTEYINNPFDANISSEFEEDGEERFSFRKSHEFDERNSFPDAFDSIGYASKKKNTPLKSINTKTKGSLMNPMKNMTPNKSFSKSKSRYNPYEIYNDDSPPTNTQMYKYTPGEGHESTILTRKDYSIVSKRIERPFKQDSPAIAI